MLKRFLILFLTLSLNTHTQEKKTDHKALLTQLLAKNPYPNMSAEERSFAEADAKNAHQLFNKRISAFIESPDNWFYKFVFKKLNWEDKINDFESLEQLFFFTKELNINGKSLFDTVSSHEEFSKKMPEIIVYCHNRIKAIEEKTQEKKSINLQSNQENEPSKDQFKNLTTTSKKSKDDMVRELIILSDLSY